MSSDSDSEDVSGNEIEDVENEYDDHVDSPDPESFADIGIKGVLLEAIEAIGWKKPTPIQLQSIPEAIAGRDVIGLAETGLVYTIQ